MLKQHCEICDRVIPSVESYRTVHFGRGHNPNINVGYDPIVICKTCWKKMEAAVKPDGIEIEREAEAALDKHIEEQKKRTDNLVEDIMSSMVKGTDKSCESCRFNMMQLTDEPCNKCLGKNKWEAKINL